jgi:hypothetical protein
MWQVPMQSKIYQSQFRWEVPQPRDPYLHLSIRRTTLNALLGSLILHLLALFVVPPQLVGTGEPSATTSESLIVKLGPRIQAQVGQASTTSSPETLPQPLTQHRQVASAPSVVALNKSHAKDLTKPANPVTSPLPSSEPLADMQAYINAARARRRAVEGPSSKEASEANGHEREPSEDEIKMAIVKRNLNPGTNGVFQILSMESRQAAFSFRGWSTDSSNSHREYIQVEIGTNSNIELAIVRRMIELIRKYYKGDFNWESERLDRIVVLSARTEDNTGLEEFMLKEFFGARPRISRIR